MFRPYLDATLDLGLVGFRTSLARESFHQEVYDVCRSVVVVLQMAWAFLIVPSRICQRRWEVKILSCVPEQKRTFEEKLAWMETTIKKHKPNLLVTPQEFFGGIQNVWWNGGRDVAYEQNVVLDPVLKLSKKHGCGIAFGAVVFESNGDARMKRERVYVVDCGEVKGYWDKMFLPAYDHIDVKGSIGITPCSSFEERMKTAEVQGARVNVLFCWEVFSNYLWHVLARSEPDIVLSMIKFGICGWPRKGMDEQSVFGRGFGYGSDGGWLDRLTMAARFDVACPIVCSTNGWDLPARARPLAGVISHYQKEEHTLWHPPSGTRGLVQPQMVMTEVNHLFSRYSRENKHKLQSETNMWPTSEVHEATMMWKVKRREKEMLAAALADPASQLDLWR
jgi:hypothetical protein